jgi:hypothetical protein
MDAASIPKPRPEALDVLRIAEAEAR